MRGYGPAVVALAALAVYFAAPPVLTVGRGAGTRGPADLADVPLLRRWRPALAGLALIGCWVFAGGAIGALLGLVAFGWAWRVLGQGESPSIARRRRELEEALPLAVHLLGAGLRAGSAVAPALAMVGDAMPGAVADELRRITARLDLGADPGEVWADVGAGGPLAPLGLALARSYRSGASVTLVVDRLSEEMRRERRLRAEARARTVEVRAAAPLGLCLLPAFLVLGVVPLTVGVFSSLHVLR